MRLLRLLLPACFVLASTSLAQVSAGVSDDGPSTSQADTARPAALTNDSIVRMKRAGLDDDLILQTVRTQPGRYALGADDLIALQSAGVSAEVIAAMQARSSGLSQRTRAAESAPVNVSPLAPGIDEIGVYYKDKSGQWQELRTERVYFRSSGFWKSTLTDHIVKQDMNGRLDGAKSTLRLTGGTELLVFAPPGTQPEEYVMLRLEEHSNNREFRARTGGVFHSETGTQRDELGWTPIKIAPQTYTWTIPADIVTGEYGMLPPASSNQRGIAGTGKIFTFSVVNDRPR